MKNPCKECIVQASCQIPCEEFTNFIKKYTSIMRGLDPQNKICAPSCIRRGKVYAKGNFLIRKQNDEPCLLTKKGYYD